MTRLSTVFITIIAFVCILYSFLAILGGDMTSAPKSGFCKAETGENLNDVHCVMHSKNGEIYTLGYTCIQKFDKLGVFKGGAYFSSNFVKHVSNSEFLSLNKGNVVLLNCNQNMIYILNDGFDIVDKIEVDHLYNEDDFYVDYPNTDISDEEARLSFWNNTVIVGDSKIKLGAPRNRLFSRDIGMLLLLISITFILAFKSLFKE